MTGKHIVFDVVGTVVGYDAFLEAFEERLGDKLLAQDIKPRLFAWAWMEAADLESNFLRVSGHPKLFKDIFQPLLYRYLAMAGIGDPHEFVSLDDAEYIVSSYSQLKARPGIHECIARLQRAGFTVWALTSGDASRVKSYLLANEIPIANENFIACESIGATKPAPEVYRHVLAKFPDATETWFAACHMWDAAAAKHNGFKAAWCSAWEKLPVPEVFGEVDVVAKSLEGMADAIVFCVSGLDMMVHCWGENNVAVTQQKVNEERGEP